MQGIRHLAQHGAAHDVEEGLEGLGQGGEGADMLEMPDVIDESNQQLWDDNVDSSDDQGEFEESSVSTENVYSE
jgi:hypothetical protein